MAIQSQIIWDAVADVKKDVSDVSSAAKLRGINYVNTQFRQRVLEVEPSRVISSSTISQTSGTQAYALPADFESETYDGCGLFRVDNSVQTEVKLPYTGFGSQQQGYYIEGSNIYLTPVPTTTATYTLKYIPLQTEITALTDSLPSYIDFKYVENVKNALMVWYEYFDQNLGGEAVADQRFVRALNMFGETISRSPMVRAVFDISSAY
jgi:hypothetical protein